MDSLKQMYKQLPMPLLRNKWDLCFLVSCNVYNEIKDKLHNGKFMGIDVKIDFRIEKDKMYCF